MTEKNMFITSQISEHPKVVQQISFFLILDVSLSMYPAMVSQSQQQNQTSIFKSLASTLDLFTLNDKHTFLK
jgi:hypothetical protein